MRLLTKKERGFLEDLSRNGRMPVDEFVAQYKELEAENIKQFVITLPNYFLAINVSGVYALRRDAAQRRILEFYANIHNWDRQPPDGWNSYELHWISQFLDRGFLKGPPHEVKTSEFNWPKYKKWVGFKLDLTATGRAALTGALATLRPSTVALEKKGLIYWDITARHWRITPAGREKLGRKKVVTDWSARRTIQQGGVYDAEMIIDGRNTDVN